MTRGHYTVALAVSAVGAFLLLLLAAWMTGGAYSSNRVRGLDLALVFPMVIAVKVGFDRLGALAIAFFTYFAMVFACVAWYIVSGDTRRGKERGLNGFF